MNYKIVELNDLQVEDIENRLEQYDKKHITYEIPGSIKVGVVDEDKLIAGVDACLRYCMFLLYLSMKIIEIIKLVQY